MAKLCFAKYHNIRSSALPPLPNGPHGSETDTRYIFFTLNLYQAALFVTFCNMTTGTENSKV